jgi:anti-sigma factor RsiW
VLVIEISCRAIHKLISEYVDGELDPQLRARLEEHFRVCRHCTAILDGTKNIVRLALGGRVFDLPAGFGQRLLNRLKEADSVD